MTACSGVAMVLGSLIVSVMPRPRNRVRVIYLTMLFSLGIENFLLAFSRNPIVWCVGQILGWMLVPVMSANQNVIMRNVIPVSLQGRVYACRNTLQFFTIPIGLACGGFMVDQICEPYMAANQSNEWLKMLLNREGLRSGAHDVYSWGGRRCSVPYFRAKAQTVSILRKLRPAFPGTAHTGRAAEQPSGRKGSGDRTFAKRRRGNGGTRGPR